MCGHSQIIVNKPEILDERDPASQSMEKETAVSYANRKDRKRSAASLQCSAGFVCARTNAQAKPAPAVWQAILSCHVIVLSATRALDVTR